MKFLAILFLSTAAVFGGQARVVFNSCSIKGQGASQGLLKIFLQSDTFGGSSEVFGCRAGETCVYYLDDSASLFQLWSEYYDGSSWQLAQDNLVVYLTPGSQQTVCVSFNESGQATAKVVPGFVSAGTSGGGTSGGSGGSVSVAGNGWGQISALDDLSGVIASFLALGVGCGGLVYGSSLLFSFFKSLTIPDPA